MDQQYQYFHLKALQGFVYGVPCLLYTSESRDLILAVITQRMVNLGLVKMEMRKAAKRVTEAIPI